MIMISWGLLQDALFKRFIEFEVQNEIITKNLSAESYIKFVKNPVSKSELRHKNRMGQL